MTQPIVVATDGSPGARAAVEWAADDAARRQAPLRVVHALDRLPYDIPRYPVPDMYDRLTRSGTQILQAAEQAARRRQPSVETTTELVEGDPVRVLRQQADQAVELVLGSRGLGGFAGMLLGSVSMHLAGHVSAPVVVVRPGPLLNTGEIAVGFDGSSESESALAYAMQEAALRGARVRAIYAWQLPVHVYAPEITYDMDEVRQAHKDYAAGKLAAWRDTYPGVEAVLDAVCAHPVTALAEASEKADLLVVGSRGRGALGSVVLGSVSRGVLHHAQGPVAVVRTTAEDTTGDTVGDRSGDAAEEG